MWFRDLTRRRSSTGSARCDAPFSPALVADCVLRWALTTGMQLLPASGTLLHRRFMLSVSSGIRRGSGVAGLRFSVASIALSSTSATLHSVQVGAVRSVKDALLFLHCLSLAYACFRFFEGEISDQL